MPLNIAQKSLPQKLVFFFEPPCSALRRLDLFFLKFFSEMQPELLEKRRQPARYETLPSGYLPAS
ncbi:hypothetical protein Anas_06073 [Armadillidium nasatum]|uniref:Uncharacterized protein n=1 Tax=Armadillidium nasatum TaxID=96803 RepID=A0A5N5TNY2_9CRUS|nr:hypothetical protein Anas_06073 [Armadillidium nasatum]